MPKALSLMRIGSLAQDQRRAGCLLDHGLHDKVLRKVGNLATHGWLHV